MVNILNDQTLIIYHTATGPMRRNIWLLFIQNQMCSWLYCLYAAISSSRYKQIPKNCS